VSDMDIKEPIDLLNSVLAESRPDETILLPLYQAEIIAMLDEQELGSLCDAIRRRGVVRAFEEEGLFSRKVVISYDDAATFALFDAPVSELRASLEYLLSA
jgi:hypothetical protein